MIGLPSNCINLLKKQNLATVETEQHLLNNIKMFEQFTYELGAAASLINVSLQKLRMNIV